MSWLTQKVANSCANANTNASPQMQMPMPMPMSNPRPMPLPNTHCSIAIGTHLTLAFRDDVIRTVTDKAAHGIGVFLDSRAVRTVDSPRFVTSGPNLTTQNIIESEVELH